MTNANPIIQLRNRAIVWISLAVIFLIGSWYVYGFFGGTNTPVSAQIEELRKTNDLIKKE